MGGVVLILAAIVIGAWPHADFNFFSSPHRTKLSTQSSVPASFYSFTGRITAVNGPQVAVEFQGFLTNGQVYAKTYHVTVDPQTRLSQASGTAASLGDLVVNRSVIVSGNTNLAGLSAFTATSITLN